MALDPVSSLNVSPAYQQDTKATSSLDKDGFLKMLTAQIKNQDPSSGQDPNQYFQTISSMTLVEQVTNLATLERQGSAESLLGRTVSYNDKDGKPVSGVVDGVTLAGSNGPTISVDGVTGIDPGKIGSVR
jgi:flagellar basal-body rod modification protein FlgD